MYESHGPLKDAVVRALHGVSRWELKAYVLKAAMNSAVFNWDPVMG